MLSNILEMCIAASIGLLRNTCRQAPDLECHRLTDKKNCDNKGTV